MLLGMNNGEPMKAPAPISPPSAPNAPAPRIGHKERDDAVERLRTAAGDGRITLDELEIRVEAALEARTADDIDALMADLPEPKPTGPAAVALAAATQPARLAASHGKVERFGAWHVPDEVTIELRHSACILDLRTPTLPSGGVRVAVQARHSTIRVLVAENAIVDLSNVGRHHSTTVDRRAKHVTSASGPLIMFTGDLHHSVIKILRPRSRRARRALMSG